MHRGTPLRLVWLHVFGLWAVAVAHPLLEVLGRSAEFFVAHRASAPDVLLLLTGLLVPAPLLLVAIVGLTRRAGPRSGSYAAAFVVGMLAAVAAVPPLKGIGMDAWLPASAAAVVVGLLAGFAYLRLTALRTFLTVLGAAAVVVVPAFFLLQPGIGRMVLPERAASSAANAASGSFRPVPVVMIVLDELPLVSLLDASRTLDSVFYPNLSTLAKDGVWFRNATTVSDYTRWALPAILTGRRPQADDVPTPADHPDTLFSFFGQTHRLEVFESVTDLCPRRLCGGREAPLKTRLMAIGRDVAILAAYVFLTPDLHKALQLPELTGNWAGLGADDAASDVDASPGAWLRRWHQAREQNKRGVTFGLIDGISAADPQPTFYFLHTLLSHHPWVLLPSGQQNSPPGALPSAMRATVGDDEWVIVQQHQRHLLQVGFIDRVIGRLVDRLRAAGLYDRALVVITADHGAAFTPGHHMRSFSPETAAEIVRVPLVMKFPADVDVARLFPHVNEAGQRMSDRNVETIDIAPTVADALGAPLPWPTDGSSVLRPGTQERREKLISFSAGKKTHRYGAEGPSIDAALRRRLAWFDGPSNTYRMPRPPRYAELIGQPIADLPVTDSRDAVDVRYAWRFAEYDPTAAELPLDVSGRLKRQDDDARVTYLAVALNGVVRAVTRTWRTDPTSWTATPPLDAWRRGRNDIEIFAIEDGPHLRRIWKTEARPSDLNLISGVAEHYWNVRQRGFYPHEGKEDRVFRWTRGHGRVTLDVNGKMPSVLHAHLLRAGPKTTRLEITANGCRLYEGPAPRREWRRTFPLDACALSGSELTIVVASDTPPARRGRRLGIAVKSLSVE